MRTTPLCHHPDPDNTSGGNNRGAPRAPGVGASISVTSRANPHASTNTDGEADTSAANPDVRTGEIRQDLMPDLDRPNGGTPNPT
jgi:hypothetical protein